MHRIESRPCRLRGSWLGALLSFAALAVPVLPAAGQEEASPPGAEAVELPSAIEILDRALQAMGGREAIESIRSARFEYEAAWAGRINEVRVRFAAPRRFVQIRDDFEGRTEYGSDGDVGWHIFLSGNSYMCSAAFEGQLDAGLWRVDSLRHYALHLVVLELYEGADVARVEGRVNWQEHDCYKVVIPYGDRKRDDAYFDVETGLLVGIESTRPFDTWMRVTTDVYEEWQPCGPIKLFKRWRQQLEPAPNWTEMTITSAEFNPVAGIRITPPDAVVEIVRTDLLRRSPEDRPLMISREEIAALSTDEAREVLVGVARLRKEYRDRGKAGEGDEAAAVWLKWEHQWLMDRLREQTGPRAAAPVEAPPRFDVPEPLTGEQIGAMSKDEVRGAARRAPQARRRVKGGDPALNERLRREQGWLLERLRELR